MVNIMKFFPDLSPIDDLAVVIDKEDYMKNQSSYRIRKCTWKDCKILCGEYQSIHRKFCGE